MFETRGANMHMRIAKRAYYTPVLLKLVGREIFIFKSVLRKKNLPYILIIYPREIVHVILVYN